MFTIQTAKLTKIIHKHRCGGIIRVLCKVTLNDDRLINCYCEETEFPIHFLPLLINQKLCISSFDLYLDYLKLSNKPPKYLKDRKSLDLRKALPTKILPLRNQPVIVHAFLFDKMYVIGNSYQSLIQWAPEQESPISPKEERLGQIALLEKLYRKSQGKED